MQKDDSMSRCRCSDISNTENKIRKLERAKGIMSGYSSASGCLESELQQWANSAKQATISAKVASGQSKMTTLGKGMNQAADGILGKINAKLNELRSSLNSMRSENHNYLVTFAILWIKGVYKFEIVDKSHNTISCSVDIRKAL